MSLLESKPVRSVSVYRARLEARVWRHTPKDYRSMFDGERHILVMGRHGTTLAPLRSLTDADLRDRLPRPR